jgi:hypothetical protein
MTELSFILDEQAGDVHPLDDSVARAVRDKNGPREYDPARLSGCVQQISGGDESTETSLDAGKLNDAGLGDYRPTRRRSIRGRTRTWAEPRPLGYF